MSNLEAQILERLRTVSVGTVVYVLQKAGLRRCFMQGVTPVSRSAASFVGRARTLRTVPAREDLQAVRAGEPKWTDPQRRAIDEITAGQVLVIDARGRVDAATLGDLLAQRIYTAGGAAVVTDGAVRDLPALEDIGLPIFAGGASAVTFSSQHFGVEVDAIVGCAEVTVVPGDYLVGDPEGVAVIPAQRAEEISIAAVEQETLDAYLRRRIAEGLPLREAYPPTAEVRADFEAELAARLA